MDAVAAEAGLAKGSLYNYFRSKQDLFQQIFADTMANAEARSLEIINQRIPAAAKIGGVLDHWFSRFGYHRRIGKLFLEFWASAARQQQGELGTAHAGIYAKWREILGEVISQGVAEGTFRDDIDPKVAASLLLAILDGIEVQSILDLGLTVDKDFLARLKRAVLIALMGRRDIGESNRGETE